MHKSEINLEVTLEDQAFDEAMRTHFPSLGIEDLDPKQLDVAQREADKLLQSWRR